MKEVKGGHLEPFKLMPAKPGKCQVCAVEHDPAQPHNKRSLFYQYAFFNEYGRWPTWADAMEHCDDEVKRVWKEALEKMGVALID
jgi:hypothetical protein